MYWLIGRKSQLTTENKLLLYKVILKPIWSYGVQLWGCAKPSNTKILQRIQSKILRIAFNAPWHISNKTLHADSGIPPVEDEIKRLTNNHIHNLTGQPNVLTSHLLAPHPQRTENGYTEHGQQTYLAKEQSVDSDRWIKCHLFLENCHWTAPPFKVSPLTQFTYSLPRQIVNTLNINKKKEPHRELSVLLWERTM